MLRLAAVLGSLLFAAANVPGQQFLDKVQDNLNVKTHDGFFQANLSMLLDLEGYYVDERPPGLLYPDQSFFNPRASFFVDTSLGNHFYGFLQARVDRGFDPGETSGADARLDEYLLRWMPLDRSLLNLQFGKFATVVGSWVRRHDSWQNPLIDAPLPYENVTIVSDEYPPASPAAFLARKSLPDNKNEWVPVIWGPVYSTGWAVFGSVNKFDYAFDLKNVALSARPERWTLDDDLWRYPTVSGRIGFRPNTAWDNGLSFSFGPYLSAEAQDLLPPGKGIADFDQITLDYDISYAWRRWQLWAEVFLTRFDVPNVGNADALTYYIEAKYKITSGLYAAARWNQQLFGNVDNGAGGQEPWDNDMFRIDAALGYRFSRHLQSKIQYSYGHRNTTLQQGEQLVAVQVTLSL